MTGFLAGMFFAVLATFSMLLANNAITRIFQKTDGTAMGFRSTGKKPLEDPIFSLKPSPMFGVEWDNPEAKDKVMWDIIAGRQMKEARGWLLYYCTAPVLAGAGIYMALHFAGLW
jgi:hypothetical protein